MIKLAKPTYTLDELLSLSPSGVVTKDDDDREWLSDPAVGQESS